LTPVSVSQSARVHALAELIRQLYALDPGALEYLVEESLGVPDGTVRVVCFVLDAGDLSAIERENVENFVRRAATKPSIQRALERSAHKKGRCRKAEKAWLRRTLSRSVGRAGTGGTVSGLSRTPHPHQCRALTWPSLHLRLAGCGTSRQLLLLAAVLNSPHRGAAAGRCLAPQAVDRQAGRTSLRSNAAATRRSSIRRIAVRRRDGVSLRAGDRQGRRNIAALEPCRRAAVLLARGIAQRTGTAWGY
jgi:hypothetical protein